MTPSNANTSGLAPCPFCGGEAWLNDYDAKYSDLPPMSRAPQCRSCGASLGYLTTPAKATEAWNRRVTAASAQAKVAELEALVASIRRAQRDVIRAEIEQEGYSPISDANDRATAAEARADRLAKALEPFAVPHECDGHATVEDFNMEVQIFVRWSVIKAARAALQQETQP